MALIQHKFDLIVGGQLFDGERHSFGHRHDRVGYALEMGRQVIEKPVGRPHRGCHQQRLRSREVPIDGLARHAKRTRHVGDPHRGAVFVDDLVGGIQDACDRLLVGGGRVPCPTVTAHSWIITSSTPLMCGQLAELNPVEPLTFTLQMRPG
jgi:hypothetical protein